MKLKMKSFVAGAIVATIGMTTIFAASQIKSVEFNLNRVVFDGEEIDMTASPMLSVVKEGDTAFSNYMPLRAVLEAMGYEVTWNGEAKTVYIKSKPDTAPTPNEEPDLVGAYSKDEKLSEDDLAIFNEAMKDIVGVKYEPVLVSRQIVAGTNYRFTTTATPVTLNAEPYVAYVYIFKPLGDAHPELVEIIKI